MVGAIDNIVEDISILITIILFIHINIDKLMVHCAYHIIASETLLNQNRNCRL